MDDRALRESRFSHQRTIPSPTDANRESVLGSMGRTCWQSGSFSRAVLIQFTKANRSSSVNVDMYKNELKHQRYMWQFSSYWLITAGNIVYYVSSLVNDASVPELHKVKALRQTLAATGEKKEKTSMRSRLFVTYQRTSVVCLRLTARTSLQ